MRGTGERHPANDEVRQLETTVNKDVFQWATGEETSELDNSSNCENDDDVVSDIQRNNLEDTGVEEHFSRKMDLTVGDLRTCLTGHP